MTPREAVELKRIPAIRGCERHLKRLCYAATRGKGLFPMDSEAYQRLTDCEIAILDRMLVRFGRLQSRKGGLPPPPKKNHESNGFGTIRR